MVIQYLLGKTVYISSQAFNDRSFLFSKNLWPFFCLVWRVMTGTCRPKVACVQTPGGVCTEISRKTSTKCARWNPDIRSLIKRWILYFLFFYLPQPLAESGETRTRLTTAIHRRLFPRFFLCLYTGYILPILDLNLESWNMRVCKRNCRFSSKWIRKKAKYANSKLT